MKSPFANLFIVLFAFLPTLSFAQDFFANNDTICVTLGQDTTLDVAFNDTHPPDYAITWDPDSSSCVNLTDNGVLKFSSEIAACCGDTLRFTYSYVNCQGVPPFIKCFAEVMIIIKCPKPDCFFVNMEDYIRVDSTQPCALACENSTSTYSATYNPTSIYNWSVTGGTYVHGVNMATIDVFWGPMGPGAVSVDITNSGVTTTISVCVDILEGPVASFTTSATSICKNASVTFTNTSTGASGPACFWDFGDGTSATTSSAMHTYTTPGVHTACLIVTRNNFDAQGNALCCCSDTTCVDITVDPLEGPKIYCVSTLCENDSTKYWTDAKNCASYIWTVLDANGASVLFSGQGTNMIFVQWGLGPVGTVSLEVAGCDDLYCTEPVTVTIPIIPATAIINGKMVVCENASETYTVPKWISVYYDWEVIGASSWTGEGTNSITVNWGAAGTGTITLHYYSNFLNGLPGHDPADCMGAALLKVDIKPRFDFGPHPGTICTGSTSTLFATGFPLSTYNWTISGSPAPSFSGQGSSSINVTWDAGPGTFIISATPTNPMQYCNGVATMYVKVLEAPPPTGIDGPLEICPGETHTYFAQTNQAGMGFNWTVTGGNVSSFTGNPLTVTWNSTGPYSIDLQQFMLASPMCSSQVITKTVLPKVVSPFSISGVPSVCINAQSQYTAISIPPQHAGATYHWAFSASTAALGSVVGGQGTDQALVQWNNTAGLADLMLTIELCGIPSTVVFQVMVNDPFQPVIAQNGIFCPGVPFTLSAADPNIDTYLWSTTETTSSISSTSVGVYTVHTIDNNGCASSATYTATGHPDAPSAPPAEIIICNNLTPGAPATVTATAPNCVCSYSWACNSIPVGGGNPFDFLIHGNTGGAGAFLYTVTVTDANGCTAVSQTTVIESLTCPPAIPCIPDTYTLSFTTSNPPPNCDIVTFAASSSNVNLLGWDFGDQTSGPNTPNTTHQYTKADCYDVVLTAKVLNTGPQPPGSDSCIVKTTSQVCVPLVADFSYSVNCSTVTFTDQSSFLPSDAPPLGWTWSWTFGDPLLGTSTMQNPVYSYADPGSYSVTLTVTNAGGCVSTAVKTIPAGGLSVPDIQFDPDPVCVGDPVDFSVLGAGGAVVQWDWDFDDGSTNGSPTPSHAYLLPGLYNVGLTITDAEGCQNMITEPYTVNPLPSPQVITALPGLTVCENTPVMLSVPFVPGYMYIWSDAAASTTNSIFVTQAGTYSVTITDANECSTVPDPVILVVYPMPQASVSGNPYFCDNGCTTLSAPSGQNYDYLWSNSETTRTINVCSAGVYSVIVTDNSTSLHCSAASAPFTVMGANSPVFTIDINPTVACEGTPTILKVDPQQADVIYAWSNGATGLSITVTQAGTYHAVGTDTVSGCKGTASAVIHPLPDLCLVPVGCYEVCNPDMICGPPGLDTYQWNLNGFPISGSTDACLAVTQSGTYSLTGTNSFGCTATSDSLILKVIDCTCYGLSASASSGGTNACCWNLSYTNPLNSLYQLVIRSNDAGLSFNSLSGPFSTVPGINSISLTNSISNTLPIASGTLSNFISVCLSNVVNTPQRIIFDWYDVNGDVICSDTVELFSQHILTDTIFLCPNETVELGGSAYTAPNIVMVTLPGTGGECDTLATYHLLLSPVYTITLNCPSNITVSAAPGETTAVVNYTSPTATSTCPGSIPAVSSFAGLPSGSPFPLGETTVCYLAKEDAQCCSKADTCCFKITVLPADEEPCDEQMTACVKFALLDITKDAAGNQTYRMRVTNNCANKLIYAAFQVPDGITASAPANNAVYTAPSGRNYNVRNPNFSPYYSIRFKSIADSINNGQSEIFKYTLPPQVCQGCILATVRLSTQIYYQAHLCCVMPANIGASPTVLEFVDLQKSGEEIADEMAYPDFGLPSQFSVFPNPTDGTLFADLSDWEGQRLQVQVYNLQGQLMQSLLMNAGGSPQQVDLPKDMSEGLYFLEVLTGSGARQMARFVLNR